MELTEDIICPECGKSYIINDNSRGEIVCETCGFVIEDHTIDLGPEWRVFNKLEIDKRIRAGGPEVLTLFDKGLATEIDRQNKDYTGKKLTPQQSKYAYKVRKWNNRLKFYDGLERNLYKALSELNLICSILRIPKGIKDEAAILYRKILKKYNLQGRNARKTVIACLYIACRLRKAPISYKDFTKELGIKRKDLNKYIGLVKSFLEVRVPTANPNDFISRYCSELELSSHIQEKVYEMLEKIKKTPIWSGRNPTKFLAAVIYVVSFLCEEKRTQAEISKVTKVSEVTLRNRSKDILKALKIKLYKKNL